MDTTRVPQPHRDDHEHEQDHPHACLNGYVYLGRLVEEDGEEVEVIEAVPCRRCADSR